MALQHLRSSTADKRPTPAAMSDGQLALNTNLASPGLFFKDSNGDSVKIGPVHVGTTAPNVTPGAGGQAGNSKGEAWLDTTATNPILKVWNGSAFVAVQPVGTGTVVSTTDTGTVTSTMILDGTILNADINASAAIVDTKLATIATGGKVSNSATTATNANTASAIVARDASGNFTAGTITAALTGAASSNVLKAGDTMTGALVVPLASAATPSLTFTGDLNTGIYSPGADQLAVATNGTEKLIVLSNGNVGIGTSSPGSSLHVNTASGDCKQTISASAGTTSAFTAFVNTTVTTVGTENSAGGNLVAGSSAYATILSNSGAYPIQFGTNNTVRATLDSSGRLGIGSTAPQEVLDVNGRGRFQGSTSSAVSGAGLELAYVSASTKGQILSYNRGTSTYLETNIIGNPLTFNISGSEAARIDTSSRLLVGTSSNSGGATCQVVGSVQASNTFRLSSNTKNGGTSKPIAIETISTDGGNNNATVYGNNRYGAGKYVLLAAFNASGDAVDASATVGDGSTFVYCITNAATNFPTT